MSALVIDIQAVRKLVQELHRIHRHDARAAGVRSFSTKSVMVEMVGTLSTTWCDSVSNLNSAK